MGQHIPQSEIDAKVKLAEEVLNYTFNDKRFLVAALTHPSAVEENPAAVSYERLEFLGDSIVGMLIASAIFKRFPGMDEGGLTRIKVALVSGASLSETSKTLGLTEAIIFGGSERGTGTRGLHSALENVYEALTAAIYLDGGLSCAEKWVFDTLGDKISADYALEPENPKSSLQEILQINRITPTYEIIEVSGPPHDRMFTSVVFAGDDAIGEGKGRSKKEAEAAAAQDAIERMRVAE